jgi:predicted dehydrogenase
VLQGAVIGCGNIALRGHLPAFRSDADLADRARIVAVVDMVAPSAEHADLLQGAKFFNDIETCVREVHLDFVDICSPPNTHAAAIRACAAAGLHILCEKPLADRNDATAAIGTAVRAAGVVFVPCHQYKYAPLWSAIGRCIAGGELGRVTLARFEVLRTQADPGTAKWNPAWRTSKELGGGGILTDTGAHYFYLARWMFGMPRRVTAVLRTLKHAEYGVEDTAAVTLEYDESIVQLGLTWAANGRANSAYVAGTQGSLAYDGARLVLTNEAGTREIPIGDVSDKSQYVAWYAALGREFVRRIETRDQSYDLLEEAEAVMRLLDVTYQAGAEHRTLDL